MAAATATHNIAVMNNRQRAVLEYSLFNGMKARFNVQVRFPPCRPERRRFIVRAFSSCYRRMLLLWWRLSPKGTQT